MGESNENIISGNVLSDFKPEHCAARNTDNMVEYWKYFSQSKQVKFYEDDEIFHVDCGLTYDEAPFGPNCVLKANLKPETMRQRIEKVIDYYTSKNMPFWWYICPASSPSNLGEVLKSYSFSEMDGTPVMAVKLDEMIVDRKKPNQLEILEVTDESGFREWWDLWVNGYPQPEVLGKKFADITAEIGYHPSNMMKFYTGYYDGEPAGTTFILIGAGVVALYGVTVLPKMRGKGIGTELSLHPLRIARTMGLKIGVLDATEQGIGIYQRIGFKKVMTPKIYIPSSPQSESTIKHMNEFMHSQRK